MKISVRNIVSNLSIILVLLFLHSCGKSSTVSSGGEEVMMKYAELLTLKDFDGYTVAEIRNPWDSTKLLQKYVLLEGDGEVPAGFSPEQIIRVPLDKSVVYSAVHNSLIEELGAGNAISGICDVEYIFEPSLKERIKKGEIADCGNNVSPNVEEIIRLSPGAILLSPYENTNGHGKLSNAGIPIVECADYMENSPLARAEWMKFYGRLYGRKEKADSLFNETEKQYLQLKQLVSESSNRPKVLFDRIYGQSWSQPAGKSTIGIMLEDSGASNPFGDKKVLGSLQLSPEKVLYKAQDCDIWLIRYTDAPLTLKSLGEDKEIYTKFKAYNEGNVYGSDASKSRIFEDVAFHPQWLLADMISLFHPEVELGEKKKTYFEKLEP